MRGWRGTTHMTLVMMAMLFGLEERRLHRADPTAVEWPISARCWNQFPLADTTLEEAR